MMSPTDEIAALGRHAAPEPHAPGVYANMSEEEYHADPSLGSSDISNLLASPEHYWFNSPHNPECAADTDSVAKTWGRAHHKILLEGEGAYEDCYAVRPEREDYPDAIDTNDELKELCRAKGLAVSGKKSELCARLRAAGEVIQVWAEEKEQWALDNADKVAIPADLDRAVRRARRLLDMHPELAKALTGGYGEVSIFYRDPETGTPLKARPDYLTTLWMPDLKTFSNPQRKPVMDAVEGAIMWNRYYRQTVHYSMLVEAAKSFPDDAFVGFPPEWVKEFKDYPKEDLNLDAHQTFFIFIGTDTPCVRAVALSEYGIATKQIDGSVHREPNRIWQVGHTELRYAINIYNDNLMQFGLDTPWLHMMDIQPFDDSKIPLTFGA